jgi:hypothetical protein
MKEEKESLSSRYRHASLSSGSRIQNRMKSEHVAFVRRSEMPVTCQSYYTW